MRNTAKLLLKQVSFYEEKIVVKEKLNTVKVIFRAWDSDDHSDEEVLDLLREAGVIHIRRLRKTNNESHVDLGEIVRVEIKVNERPLFVATFKLHFLPSRIHIGCFSGMIDPYIPIPVHCFRCLGLKHVTRECTIKRLKFVLFAANLNMMVNALRILNAHYVEISIHL